MNFVTLTGTTDFFKPIANGKSLRFVLSVEHKYDHGRLSVQKVNCVCFNVTDEEKKNLFEMVNKPVTVQGKFSATRYGLKVYAKASDVALVQDRDGVIARVSSYMKDSYTEDVVDATQELSADEMQAKIAELQAENARLAGGAKPVDCSAELQAKIEELKKEQDELKASGPAGESKQLSVEDQVKEVQRVISIS